MTTFLTILACNLMSLSCAIGSIYLVHEHNGAWPWFLLAALFSNVSSVRFKNQNESSKPETSNE